MIDTVFLDAGGVLCHPSWIRVADALVRHGAPATAAALAAAEQRATHELDRAEVIRATDDRSRGWLYFNLVLRHARIEQNAATDAALAELREYHKGENLWEHVEPDVEPALAALRGSRPAAGRGVERQRPVAAPVRSAAADALVRSRARFP